MVESGRGESITGKRIIRNGGLLCVMGIGGAEVHSSNGEIVGFCVGWRVGCYKYKLLDSEMWRRYNNLCAHSDW